jgi:CHAD domain-containing protein
VIQKTSSATLTARRADVLKHLADSLRTQSRRYRKRLNRCQENFSEEAVHDSRVEARRLLATVELLGAFLPDREIQKARRVLKQHLDTFDPLRDTQVQLVYVGRMTRAFPAARGFREWLLKREARFTRETRQAIKHLKTKRFTRRIAAFEEEVRNRRKHTTRDLASAAVQRAMDRAFARVARLCQRVAAADTETIHRTRIAFKRFRYMVEALSPLLPVVTDQHRHAMRGYQSMMGDIQDVEVMLAALDKFLRKQEINTAAAGRLRNELLRRRQWLIQVYLNAAGKLRLFWPPPGLATVAPKPTRSIR